jgi:hypothetical protein
LKNKTTIREPSKSTEERLESEGKN